MGIHPGDYVRHDNGKTYYVKRIDDFFAHGGGYRKKALCKEVDGARKPVNGSKATRYTLESLTRL